MRNIAKIAAAVLVTTLTALPLFAAPGTANFSKLVAIGDSYGAGYENGGIVASHQNFSWPAVLARQVGYRMCQPTDTATANCFAQPLVSEPGIPSLLQLQDLSGTIVKLPGQGSPLMLNFARPYNNVSVPGANVTDVLTIKGNESQTSAAAFILRGLGTQLEQALAQHPTFIAIWIGGNDLLSAVAGGTPNNLTPVAQFKTSYETMLAAIATNAPNAGVVIGNLPNSPFAVPLVNTVPPFIVNPATRQPVLGPDGKPIFLVADLGGGLGFGQLPAGSFVLLSAAGKLRTGYGIPGALAQVPPFNALPDVGKPLSDADVLTPTEVAAIVARANEYNTVITTAAAARGIPVADIKSLFDSVVVNPTTGAGGLQVGPIRLTNAFVSGGFFGLDGVHLTDLGYILFANQYIKAINAGYNTEIPLASITQIFANNGSMFPEASTGFVTISSEAAKQIPQVFMRPRKGRATSH